MKVHVMVPYALDKNFGRAYNEAMKMIPDGDGICFIDHDAMFLTPDAILHLHKYAEMYPDSLLTCYTNRVGAKSQTINGVINENDRMKHWIYMAEKQKKHLYKVQEMKDVISGYLMMFSKKLWNDVSHFTEELQILGVDNNFSQRVLNKGYKIYLMQGILVWHSYRLLNGKHDKRHLKV